MNNKDIFDIVLAMKIKGGGSVTVLEDKTVEPDFSDGDVLVEPSEGYDGLSSVTIEKDSDLIATNVKKDVTINGITGTYGNFESKSLTPDFSNGDVTVSPTSGYDALSSVTIEKDSDLVAENIKKDVNVFGIVGTLESGGDIDALIDHSITSIDSNVLEVGQYAFYTCLNLQNVNLPNATTLNNYCFYNCDISNINIPNVTTIRNNVFDRSNSLSILDLPKVTSIGSQAFNYSTRLKTLILRSNTVVTCNTNAFNNTPFSNHVAYGTGGTLYVPQALIASYQANNNWSTVLGYNANNQIKAIEGSPYENA